MSSITLPEGVSGLSKPGWFCHWVTELMSESFSPRVPSRSRYSSLNVPLARVSLTLSTMGAADAKIVNVSSRPVKGCSGGLGEIGGMQGVGGLLWKYC